jgi:hypothetical protein
MVKEKILAVVPDQALAQGLFTGKNYPLIEVRCLKL